MNLHRKLLSEVFGVRKALLNVCISGVPNYPKQYQYVSSFMSDWIITDNFEISLQKEPVFELLTLDSKITSVLSRVGEKDQVLVFHKTKKIEFEYLHYECIREMFEELKNAA